jgi:hypothetical protein
MGMSMNQTEDREAAPRSIEREEFVGRAGFSPSIFVAVALGLLLGLLVYRRRVSAATVGQTMADFLKPGLGRRRGIMGFRRWTSGWGRIQRAQTVPVRAWWRRTWY